MIAERFSRILVPTDMSIFARLALRWARLFHTRLGSRVTIETPEFRMEMKS